jgi:protein involved in polysaccharide export with SLBB domain
MKKAISILLIAILHLTFVIGNLSLADEYRLAPSDQLEVRIIGQKDLDTKQSIAPDGSISLPFLGRVTAQGQTLKGFNEYLTAEFTKYLSKPSQVVVYLTPRPSYVIQHNVKNNTWDVKEAKSVAEARALAGKDYTGHIINGDIVSVEVGQKPDWWEDNWYKVLTGTAVAVGIYATVRR